MAQRFLLISVRDGPFPPPFPMSAAYFGDGTQFGLEIDHFVESWPLGKRGGARKCTRPCGPPGDGSIVDGRVPPPWHLGLSAATR